jgi:hypothetical protein
MKESYQGFTCSQCCFNLSLPLLRGFDVAVRYEGRNAKRQQSLLEFRCIRAMSGEVRYEKAQHALSPERRVDARRRRLEMKSNMKAEVDQ